MSKFIREVTSQKWQGHSKQDMVMTIADMDLPIFHPIKKAILKQLEMTNNFTYKERSKQYFEAIINWYKERHNRSGNLELQPQYIISSPSITTLVYLTISIFTNEGDGVLLMTPIWSIYKQTIEYLKRKPVESRLYNDRVKNISRYDINFSDLEEKAKNCKLMILCNPHSPTGRIWSKKQLSKIIKICKKNEMLLLSDEILSDLVPQSHLHTFHSLVNQVNQPYRNIIVANSISKAFNMQSLKGGYAIVKTKEIRNKLSSVLEALNVNLNEFATNCTEIVYSNEGKQWLRYATAIIRNNHSYLIQKMKRTMLIISKYEGSQLIVLNFEAYIKFIERWFKNSKYNSQQSINMVAHFLKNHGIYGYLISYPTLYQSIYTEVRLSIAVEESQFKRFADRLYHALLQVEYVYRQVDCKL